MIRSFRDKQTEAVFLREPSRKLPGDIQKRVRMCLQRLDVATRVEELRIPPSHSLEQLHGDRAGQWSIRINDQWRVCFRWDVSHAYDVEIVGYH